MLENLLRKLLAPVLIVGTLGCPNNEGCKKDTDCKGERVCVDGTCKTENEANTGSSGASEYVFFDDFSGNSLDMEKWGIYPESTGTYSISGGSLKMVGEIGIGTNANPPNLPEGCYYDKNWSFEFRLKSSPELRFCSGIGRVGITSRLIDLPTGRDTDAHMVIYYSENSPCRGQRELQGIDYTVYNTFRIKKEIDVLNVYVNNVFHTSLDCANNTSRLQSPISAFSVSNCDEYGTHEVEIDYVKHTCK